MTTGPQLRASFDLPSTWETFDWEGTIGGARHKVSTQGFTPNILVTLDKWPDRVTGDMAIEIVSKQLKSAGARVLTTSDLGGEPQQVELQSEAQDQSGALVRTRYRLQLLEVASDTLVVTSIATYLKVQEHAIAEDLDRILDSLTLSTHAT
ncbi:hypothetical protein [Gulosibacter molinativorax]|uniref:DUF1795 domain-containing protein n=1 Tax=Gulosibacter molinativorax TaxID=256821 RepID=A0ABT7C7W6_9MICO|nr:hypothetical protein [Gulosibacter molinativorax]MDJ1371285.1 hypothetical protein [Gulosibacter molinativorax]QUY63653.1 Hypotetical protein [Gulosibacter molinativorax]